MTSISKMCIAAMLMAKCLSGSAAEPPELQWPVKKIGRTGANPQSGDMAVTLRGTGSEWKIEMDASIYQPDVEQIWFRRDGQSGEIIVMARSPNPGERTSPSICSYGPSAGSNDRSIAGYTECNSTFFKCTASAGNALRILPMLVTGTRNCLTQFDTEAVQSALKSANVSEWLLTFKENRRLTNYREFFASIRTVQEAEQFILSYQQFDPEGLVEKARQQKDTLLAAEAQTAMQKAAEQEQRRIEKLAKEEAQAKRELEMQKITQEKAKEAEEYRQKKARDFRKNLALGSETFCGPVIAIRGPMVQIAINAPLPGYSAEPWLKLDAIYPAEIAGCKNLNGRLTATFIDQ